MSSALRSVARVRGAVMDGSGPAQAETGVMAATGSGASSEPSRTKPAFAPSTAGGVQLVLTRADETTP